MKKIIPGFVLEYKTGGVAGGASVTSLSEIQKALANWVTAHTFIKFLPVTRSSLCRLADMMFVEYYRKDGPRMDIIVRLYGKFNAMRVELERTQL